MAHYHIEDEFEIDADAYWDMFFDADFSAAMFEAIDVRYELLKFEMKGEGPTQTLSRIQRLTPKREVPKLFRKFVDDAISYEEHNEWTRASGKMSVVTIPNFLGDKVTSDGTYWVESRGPGRCARLFDGRVEVRVPLVGGKAESVLVDEIKESYAKATVFTKRWIAKQG